ncbi:MAG: hypothetical protein JST54_27725 [Deltaproteobacteria bacterium]|nr:hypothetical protein [Deltaproteobacteria bacterium]
MKFVPGEAEWPSFTALLEFRRKLAAEVGLRLDEMDGFGGTTPWSTVADPIAPLLMLEDVSGSLPVGVCATVAARLEQLTRHWRADDADVPRAAALAAALQLAARWRQRLRFQGDEG